MLVFGIILGLGFVSCEKNVGCTDPSALNYDVNAEVNEGCVYHVDTTSNPVDTTSTPGCQTTYGATIDTTVVDTDYVAPDGTVYNQSGTYQVVLDNAQGCDSIITVNVTSYTAVNLGIDGNWTIRVFDGENYSPSVVLTSANQSDPFDFGMISGYTVQIITNTTLTNATVDLGTNMHNEIKTNVNAVNGDVVIEFVVEQSDISNGGDLLVGHLNTINLVQQ